MILSHPRGRAVLGGLLAVGLLTTAACASDPADDSGGESVEERTLIVFAAASLEEPFSDLGETFEADHEGVDVQFNLAGSSDLVTQINEGAPADVLATANESTMEKATDFVSETELFATNTLAIAVQPGNPKDVAGLTDLTRDDVITVICAPQVPCGSATTKVLDAAGITLSPASEESSVTGVLTKVETREADAGLVYTTDIGRAEVEEVNFPEADDAVNRYPIGVLNESEQADLAREFVDLVLSDEGQQVLGDAGFDQP